ncbi:MAG TPA: hypothetical protein VEU08_03815 [Vicinamibacterales bacterium]|nr:hypothetical protein [Vicinamibacterales bacterium]
MSRVTRAMAVLALAAGALLTTAPRAMAVTVSEIVELTKAGVSEPVILALIDRDRTIFALDADQIVSLKQQGVTETVLIAMLKSGRAEAEADMRQQSAANAAFMLSTMTTAPELVIVGHGPEIPNHTEYTQTDYESLPGMVPLSAPIPYVSPYAPPALLVQAPPCVPHRGSPCPSLRRGRAIR